MNEQLHLPEDSNEWTRDHVRDWATKFLKIDSNEADILYKQNVSGAVLKILCIQHLTEMGLTYGPAALILHHFHKLNDKSNSDPNQDVQQGKKSPGAKSMLESKQKNVIKTEKQVTENVLEDTQTTKNINQTERVLDQLENNFDNNLSKQSCKPYPFDCAHVSKRYIQHYLLPPETGILDLIEPVHEYKLFKNTINATEEDKKMKFCNEVFRFAAACMNVRTNGTIHFGISDKPHGEIIGIHIENKETYINYITQMMNKYFDGQQLQIAKQCIRPPRFVDVLDQQNTLSDKVIIEVDVVPAYDLCKSETFCTYQQVVSNNAWKKSKEMSCFIRDGSSSKDILSNVQKNTADYKAFISQELLRDNTRKQAEERLKIPMEQKHVGKKLSRLITGNRDSLDNSYYKRYILVTNKCHPNHIKHLDFMHEIQCFAVFDFDPESLINGLCKSYREKRVANLHFPSHFQDMGNSIQEKIEQLKLYQHTSWIFCNGRADIVSKDYKPLSSRLWQKEKAAEVGSVVSFLMRKDILEHGKFLVIFLLLSAVEDPVDPMNEIFRMFFQGLGGVNDILCICESEQIFQSWKDLQMRYATEEEIDNRCVYDLSIETINCTILKLKSAMQSTHRFLPSEKGCSTDLSKMDEELMTSLEILCENECQGTNIEENDEEFKTFRANEEENFYRGGKVSWWNFYFSMKNYSGPFIKRDVYDMLKDLIVSLSAQQRNISVKRVTIYHHPGCGGTTLAKHMLWELRNQFRCAIVRQKTDLEEIGEHVVDLATYGFPKNTGHFPVLLLVDDYEEEETYNLQSCVQSAIRTKHIKYEKPVVILLNCTRSQNPEQTSNPNCINSVALTNNLSPNEQRIFEDKLKTIEKQHDKPDTFYAFMILKSNFDQQYIIQIVRNILKDLDDTTTEAQLISFLALLNTYVKDTTISVSMSEKFLGITRKGAFFGQVTIEEKMGIYYTIILKTEVEKYGRYEGLRIIHPQIASCCLAELQSTFKIHKSDIILDLLKTEMFFDLAIGRDIFLQNMQSMLITRHRKEHGDETDTLFSPLIEEIYKEEGNKKVESVLTEGAQRFNQNPYICQALARHYYIREKRFTCALKWAKKAKTLAPANSFVLDTFGQIYKAQLKTLMDDEVKKTPLTEPTLRTLLEKAVLASDTFRKCQEQAKRAEDEIQTQGFAKSKRYQVFNTAGYLGEIETCLYTVDILSHLPCFNKNTTSKKLLRRYLSGKGDISIDNDSEIERDLYSVLKDYKYFLANVKSYLKKAFTFFGDYFVYFKQRNMQKDSLEFKKYIKVTEYFKTYCKIFCDQQIKTIICDQERPKGSISLTQEKYRAALESCNANRFSGILQYLTSHEKHKSTLEAIVKAYECLLEHRTEKYLLRDKQNYILANIVLSCIFPKSNHICQMKTLKEYLREVLREVRFDHRYMEPYFLACLLFWPESKYELESDAKDLAKYIQTMKKCFQDKYKCIFQAKQSIAHFYLGKTKSKRLIHKGKIDEQFHDVPGLNHLWQGGEIWKEKEVQDLLLRVNGRTENNLIFLEMGNEESIKIPVRPAHFGQLKRGNSIESVSFYLGFSMAGPIAYDIESSSYNQFYQQSPNSS